MTALGWCALVAVVFAAVAYAICREEGRLNRLVEWGSGPSDSPELLRRIEQGEHDS